MVIITNKSKKYLPAKDKKGYNRSQSDTRIEWAAKRGLEDLTFLLENASEYLQARIFTAQNLKGLFRALFPSRDKD